MKKTGKARKGTVTEETAELIEKLRCQAGKRVQDLIFTGNINSLTRKLNRHLKKLALDHSSHDFRHTKITELANAGLQIKALQDYVGHANTATTMRYVHVDQDVTLR